MITIHLESGALRRQLEELGRLAAAPRPLVAAATGSVAKFLRQHFTARDKEPNRLGGRRTHFWSKVAQSTQVGEITDHQGVVVISDPRFAQKLYGGVIRAGKSISSKTGKPTQYLAIPARRESHGLRPSQLADHLGVTLHFVPGSRGGALSVLTGKKSQLGMVMYWLVKSVTQAADPKALPQRGEIERVAAEAAQRQLRTIVQRGQPLA